MCALWICNGNALLKISSGRFRHRLTYFIAFALRVRARLMINGRICVWRIFTLIFFPLYFYRRFCLFGALFIVKLYY